MTGDDLGGRAHLPIEETPVFEEFASVADDVWHDVREWDSFAQDTVGKQLVRATDSIGANLVEGDGRFGGKESVQFFRIARGSARESRYWLNRAVSRGLMNTGQSEQLLSRLTSATRQLNGLITYRVGHLSASSVREPQTH